MCVFGEGADEEGGMQVYREQASISPVCCVCLQC